MYIHITDSLIFCLLYTLASMKLLKSLEWNNTQKEKKLSTMIWEERVQVYWMIKWQIVQLYCKINFERIVNSLFLLLSGEKNT